MDYKEVINEQIELLKGEQKKILDINASYVEKQCLIANTITELAIKASSIRWVPKEVANNG